MRRTAPGLMRADGVGVELVDGEVLEHVPDLAGLNEVRVNLRHRLPGVPDAERTLVIEVFDERRERVG